MIVPVCPCGGKAQKIAAHFEKHIHLFQLFVPGSSILFSHYIFHTKGIIRKATHKRSYIYEAGHSLFIVMLQNYVQCVGYGNLGLGFVAIWVIHDFPSHQLSVCFFSSFFARLLASAKKHKLSQVCADKRGILEY